MQNKHHISQTRKLEEIQSSYPERGELYQSNQECNTENRKIDFSKTISPTIVDPGEKYYPPYKPSKKVEIKFGHLLDDNQKEGVNRLLQTFKRNPEARVLLGDGTGLGKTMQLIATAWGIAKTTELPTLIVTKNDILLETMKADARQSDVSGKRVHFTNYAHLEHTLSCNKYSAVLFDEGHALSGHPLLEKLQEKTPQMGVVIASATAFSEPHTAVDLLGIIEAKASSKVASEIGLEPVGQQLKPQDSTNWGEVTKKLLSKKQGLMKQGKCLQRYLEFKGKAKWDGIAGITDKDVLANSLEKIITQEIKKGRKVILYSKHKAYLESALSHLEPTSIADFRVRKGNLIILDPNENAEGIRLHDKTGKHPRAIILCEPRDVDDLIQIQGRAHRRNARSASIIHGLFDPTSKEHTDALLDIVAQAIYLKEQQEACPALGERLLDKGPKIMRTFLPQAQKVSIEI